MHTQERNKRKERKERRKKGRRKKEIRKRRRKRDRKEGRRGNHITTKFLQTCSCLFSTMFFCLLTVFISDIPGMGLYHNDLFSLCKWVSIQHITFPFRRRGILNRLVQSFCLLGEILGVSVSGQCKWKNDSLDMTVAVHINHRKVYHRGEISLKMEFSKYQEHSDKFKIYLLFSSVTTVKIHSSITRTFKTCNQILARFPCFCILSHIIIIFGDIFYHKTFF